MTEAGLQICTFQVDITPPEPLPLAGYLARTGVSDAPRANALRAAATGLQRSDGHMIWLIALDTLFVDDFFAADLRADLQAMGVAIAPDNLVIVASHTHGAPHVLRSAFAGCPSVPEYRSMVLTRLASALGGAHVWHPVVKLQRGRIKGPPTVNRRRVGLYLDRTAWRLRVGAHYGHAPNGVRDPDMHALTFWTDAGLAAVWWSLAAHPAFEPDTRAVSADFPGVLRAHITATHPDAAVSFFPGLSGSVIPAVNRHPAPVRSFKQLIARLPLIPGLGGFTQDGYQIWCAHLRAVWDKMTYADLPLETGALSARMTRVENIFRAQDAPLPMNLRRISLPGGVSVVLTSGEPLAEWTQVLGPVLPKDTLVTGYCDGPPAYIAPAICLADGGYEVDGFQQAFGLRGRVTDQIDQRVCAALKALLTAKDLFW